MSFDDIVLPPHANPIVLDWLKSGKLKIMPSGCWEWTKFITSSGYGHVKHNGKMNHAHRLAINAPKGLCSLHSCDNRSCVNPSHLRVGTVHENNIDMKERGRGLRQGSLPRCDCGRAMSFKNKDCYECRAIRLDKPPCHCGERSTRKGLCGRHYCQEYKSKKQGI